MIAAIDLRSLAGPKELQINEDGEIPDLISSPPGIGKICVI
jgi:hypothetical protein